MKKHNQHTLVLVRQTIRQLATVQLGHIVGGIAGTVGGNAHPYTCTCPMIKD